MRVDQRPHFPSGDRAAGLPASTTIDDQDQIGIVASDRENDPDERVNLAFAGHTPTAEQSARERLTAKLLEVEATRLQPPRG